jgi:hypothetical protein
MLVESRQSGLPADVGPAGRGEARDPAAGVDATLIWEMLALTVEERLAWNDAVVNAVREVQDAAVRGPRRPAR